MTTAKKTAAPKPTPARDAALAAMKALAPGAVEREPGYRAARASWLRALLVPLAQDHLAVLDAPLDPPLTGAELAMFPALVELIGETTAGKQAEAAVGVFTADEVALLATLRAKQATLDRAFRVRLRGDRAALRVLADLRRGEPGDPEDALDDARRLVALADTATHGAWIARLKKGEPAAVEALRKAVPQLEGMATRAAGANPGRLGRDQMRRAWTVALTIADRIVTAGKYETGEAPGRATDYARFRRPTARRSRAKVATPTA